MTEKTDALRCTPPKFEDDEMAAKSLTRVHKSWVGDAFQSSLWYVL